MNRQKFSGFTMSELLVTAAVLSLLLAVALPSINAFFASLTLRRLDAAAEEHFLFAQNRLSYIDFCESTDDLIRNHLRVTASGNRYLSADALNPAPFDIAAFSALEADGGSVFMFLNAAGTDVISAFYSEKLSSSELEELCLTLTDLSEENRRRLALGYYCADIGSISPKIYSLEPETVVVNREDLFIEITCKGLKGAKAGEIKVELTLTGEDGKTLDLSLPVESLTDGVLTASYLLDKTTSNGGSYYIDNLEPFLGTPNNITAQARIICGIGAGSETTSERAAHAGEVSFSPLFESRSGGKITVSRSRHLNNLRYLQSGENVSVAQTQNIGFSDDYRQPSEFFRGTIEKSETFAPLPGFSGSFDGGDNLIVDLRIESGGEFAGLFSEISGEIRNLHLVSSDPAGGSSYIRAGAEICAAGAICGRALDGSRIENCSVSGMSILCGGAREISAGGLAGILQGEITRSSAICAAITADSVTAGEIQLGGLAGTLYGGSISFSHSGGKLSADHGGAITVGGIAAGGSGNIFQCYSECSAGYIGGGEYYGVCGSKDILTDNCFFIKENAWLSLTRDGALGRDDLSALDLEGFSRAAYCYPDDKAAMMGSPYPESVGVHGDAVRFGGWDLAYPRGLIGVLRAEYTGETFDITLLTCFDAYENDSELFPEIYWDDAGNGEVRYYFFCSESAAPLSAVNCTFSRSEVFLAEEELFDGYICRQIIGISGGDDICLEFLDAHRKISVEEEEATAEGLIGAIAVMYRGATTILNPDTWMPETVPAHYEYYYRYRDMATGEILTCTYTYPVDYARVGALEELTFDNPSAGEVRIYAFATGEYFSAAGSVWDFEPSVFSNITELDGAKYFELLRGESFGMFDVDFSCPDGYKFEVTFRLIKSRDSVSLEIL